MPNNLLSFITDEQLENYARQVVEKVLHAADSAEAGLYSNVVDPFSALFDSARQGLTLDEWLEQEKARQVQKTLQNALGKFHQQVLGSVPGWHDAGLGGSYDVGNTEGKIIAEIKTKHNTMNSSSAPGVYQKLAGHLQYSHHGFTAYLVEIVPKTRVPYDKPWSPNLRTLTLREDIRRIDGKSFYKLATGDEDGLKKLYEALPIILQRIIGDQARQVDSTSFFSELFLKAYS